MLIGTLKAILKLGFSWLIYQRPWTKGARNFPDTPSPADRMGEVAGVQARSLLVTFNVKERVCLIICSIFSNRCQGYDVKHLGHTLISTAFLSTSF